MLIFLAWINFASAQKLGIYLYAAVVPEFENQWMTTGPLSSPVQSLSKLPMAGIEPYYQITKLFELRIDTRFTYSGHYNRFNLALVIIDSRENNVEFQ